MYIVIYSILDVEGQTGKTFSTLCAKPSLNKVFIIIIIIIIIIKVISMETTLSWHNKFSPYNLATFLHFVE